jgi:hypothetical protein
MQETILKNGRQYRSHPVYEETAFLHNEDLKIPDMLFTSHNTPHITVGNKQCLKFLLGVCNTKRRGDISIISGKKRGLLF